MVSRGAWFGDYGDPTTFLDINRTGDGNNDRGYTNPAYDDLLIRAARERDPARRLAILTSAEQLLVETDVPFAPIFQYVQTYLFDAKKLSGISPHPRQEQDMTLIDLLGDGKGRETPAVMSR